MTRVCVVHRRAPADPSAMLLSRMFALVPVLMMMGTDGVDANADAFGDDYTVYDHALGLLEPGTPAAKKQKQLDQSTDVTLEYLYNRLVTTVVNSNM